MKVIIAGSRTFNDYEFLEEQCDKILSNIREDIVILCGEAKGADKLGEEYARNRLCFIEYYPANWNDLSEKPSKIKFGKYGPPYNALAGFNRNQRMVDEADMLIAFRVNFSSGTNDVIVRAKTKGIPVYVFEYNGV